MTIEAATDKAAEYISLMEKAQAIAKELGKFNAQYFGSTDTIVYPAAEMRLSQMMELSPEFTKQYLMQCYYTPGQKFAYKKNPLVKNSTIIFITAEFEKWRQKRIRLSQREGMR